MAYQSKELQEFRNTGELPLGYCVLQRAGPIRGLTRREKRALAQQRRISSSRISAIMLLGGRCQRCDFNDLRALQIDHVRGGGIKEIRARGWGITYNHQVMIQAHTGKYQVLCANCNWIKRFENGESSRRREYQEVA